MSRLLLSGLLVLSLLPAAAMAADNPAPVITAAGAFHPVPHAAFLPDRNATYKVVFAMTRASDKPDQVNPALERVARTVNLYAASGVPLAHLKFVAIAYGPATALVLDDAHYRAKFGVANPNLAAIAQLRKAGITLAVCGQAVAENHFEDAWVAQDVEVALSALTTITGLQQQGYALMPL
ncbi:DsrE family protein [Rhodanobacter sp. DHB23]|uniref:DsrE family protein n=1 Tax=Rhodanobacter sp. DHB23 TaxID=2775923 RepID=UPI00177CF3DB|nr:DsrE family protein [Rhodanobacter sp. DHB23]MBD8874477.1 DsrE family protein [Rhodanobacter sp. DHB23]